jgi:nitroreductase
MSFLNNIEWRRAIKNFDKQTEPLDISPIIKAIVNAPSSLGLQPYKVFAVRNAELKDKLQTVSYNQQQVSQCDTLFVFCARSDVEKRLDEFFESSNFQGSKDMYKNMVNYIPNKLEWSGRQTYIALGFALAVCAELKIGSCPMEGFSSAEVKKILELPDNLTPLSYLAVGKAPENPTVYPRFRFPESDLIAEL